MGFGIAIGVLVEATVKKVMSSLELAALLSAKLREARDLSARLGAEVLEFFIEMAIIEARRVEMELASKRDPGGRIDSFRPDGRRRKGKASQDRAQAPGFCTQRRPKANGL